MLGIRGFLRVRRGSPHALRAAAVKGHRRQPGIPGAGRIAHARASPSSASRPADARARRGGRAAGSTAIRPCSRGTWRSVVSENISANSWSSMPITLRSLGTRTPTRRAAMIAPIATSSQVATRAVGLVADVAQQVDGRREPSRERHLARGRAMPARAFRHPPSHTDSPRVGAGRPAPSALRACRP